MVNTLPFGSDYVQLRQAMQELLPESFVPSGGAVSLEYCHPGDGPTFVARCLCHAR